MALKYGYSGFRLRGRKSCAYAKTQRWPMPALGHLIRMLRDSALGYLDRLNSRIARIGG